MKKNKETDQPINLTLNDMVKDGILNEKWDNKRQDFAYSLTEDGLKKTESMIKKSDVSRAFLFSIMWNDMKDKTPRDEWLKLLVECAKDFKERFGTNLLRDIERWQEKKIISPFVIINKDSIEYEAILKEFD